MHMPLQRDECRSIPYAIANHTNLGKYLQKCSKKAKKIKAEAFIVIVAHGLFQSTY